MSTTPNYGLYLPGQGEEAWDDKMNGNLTTIDATLQALADIVEGAVYQINNVTYVAANSRWNGSTWNRVNTGAPAVRLALNSTTGTMEVATAAAGTNPITWTTVQTFSATGLDMKSKKIANLATPTAATDAATKAYIDGLIAALKLSQIAINTNLNMGNYGITANTGTITTLTTNNIVVPNYTLSEGSSTVATLQNGPVTALNPVNQWRVLRRFSLPGLSGASNAFKISVLIWVSSIGLYWDWQITQDGTVIGSGRRGQGGSLTVTADATNVSASTVFTIEAMDYDAYHGGYNTAQAQNIVLIGTLTPVPTFTSPVIANYTA